MLQAADGSHQIKIMLLHMLHGIYYSLLESQWIAGHDYISPEHDVGVAHPQSTPPVLGRDPRGARLGAPGYIAVLVDKRLVIPAHQSAQ